MTKKNDPIRMHERVSMARNPKQLKAALAALGEAKLRPLSSSLYMATMKMGADEIRSAVEDFERTYGLTVEAHPAGETLV